nr:PREDICTED: uncharacterized protein LOC105664087 [Megachile rotundata]
MAPAVAELLQSQADLFTRIDNFKRNTDKLGKDNLTVTVLKSRQRLLNSYWEKFTNNHDAIVRLPESKATEYTAKGVYDEVEAQFVLRDSELSDLIAAAERANGTSASSGSSAAVHKSPEVVLPPITLPTFSGETLEWESFRDRFRSLIHDNDRLSELQKLQYLKGALRGEAARVVEATPTMEGCYAGAFESLERRFGNPRMLSAAHLRRLIHSKAISKATPQDFKRILDEFRGSRLALKALGRPVDHWNELFVHLLSEKLDTATRISWESSLDDPTRVPAFEDLEKYLETRVHALSFAQERDRSSPSVTVKDQKRPATITPRERSALAVQVANEPTPKSKTGRVCPKCSGPHQLGFCPRFKALNPLERRDFVDAHALCSSCLSPGHTTKSCKSSYDKLGKDNLTVTVLKSRQRLLNSYWEKFTNNHDAIVRLPESKATEYTAKGVYDEVEAQFVLRDSELSDLIAAAERANGTSASSGSSAAAHKSPEMVLPPITLPTFLGETLEWESFRDRFRSLIHDNDRLSELQKLQYLKGALRGEAARVVEATSTMESAFESLERLFGNPRMLSAAHLRRLIHSKAISKATPQDFKRILDEFRDLLGYF